MRDFSIGEAWTETVSFLRDNLQLLLMLVGGGALATAIAQYLIMPGGQAAQMAMFQEALRTGRITDINGVVAAAGLGIGGGLLLIFIGVTQQALSFAALRLGLGRSDEGIAEALGYGYKAAFLTIAALVVVVLIAIICIALPMALFGVGVASGGIAAGGGPFLLFVLVALILFIWVFTRLSIMVPAMAAAGSANPLYGIRQSWAATRGRALPIFGFLLLISLAIGVVAFILSLVAAGIGGIFGAFGAALMIALLVGVPTAIVQTGYAAGLYRALVSDDEEVGHVFS